MKRFLLIFLILFLLAGFVSDSFAGTARRVGTSEQITKYGGSGGSDCGGSGCDYTSLATWESATDTDHVTDTETDVLEGYDDAASFDDFVDINGSTNNGTYFRIFRSASGEGHDGTENNGFTIDSTTNFGHAIQVQEDFFQLQDLIVTITHNSVSSKAAIAGGNTADSLFVIGCIVPDAVNSGTAVSEGIIILGADCVVVLCLVSNCEDRSFRYENFASENTHIYNTTIIDSGAEGIDNEGTSSLIAKNCLVDNSTGNDFDGTLSSSFNNASSDGTATGTDSRTSQTFTFKDSGGNDFHITTGDAGAKDFGKDLSADGTFAFDDDINDGTMGAGKAGTSWGTWDIGFNEPGAAAAGRHRVIFIGMLDWYHYN